MATVNGGSIHHASETFEGLGKRKRTSSQDQTAIDMEYSKLHDEKVQQSIEGVLKLLRNYDPSPSLLKYPLPAILTDEPDIKRARLDKPGSSQETVESRASAGAYVSLDEMVEDIDRAASAMLENSPALSEQVNGESKSHVLIGTKARQQIAAIREMLTRQVQRQKAQGATMQEDEDISGTVVAKLGNEEHHDLPQVLTLRTQTEKGPRQVYSGLQHLAQSTSTQSNREGVSTIRFDTIEGKLPPGFELAEASFLDAHTRRKLPQDSRTLGEVFRAPRTLKPLEAPRTSRSASRNAKLNFLDPAAVAFEQTTPTHKQDYKFVKLPTAEWMHYGESESSRKKWQRENSSNTITEREQAKTGALFHASYSSFAPSHDTSVAVVSERERSNLWWNKLGAKHFRRLFSLQYPVDVLENSNGVSGIDQPEDFSVVVAEFAPEEAIDDAIPIDVERDDRTNSDSILTEVSDLLETLSSYQRIRNLSTPKPSNPPNSPSIPEFDTYELLRSQLSLLIDSLPPFAVAKLNGDQLQELNITTNVVLESVDYAGAGEVDDFTLQRRKAAATAAAAAARTSTATPAAVRPNNYQTPAVVAPAAANYNSRARPYNPGLPASNPATYGSTSASQPYQTPRPPAAAPRPNYPQQAYQQTATPSYAQTNVQQFQRPLQNGYPSYGSNAASQTPQAYAQRPTQPSYQQRAQETPSNYMRSASPQKPTTNGQPFAQPPNLSPYVQNQQLPPQQRPPQLPGTPANAMYHASPEQRMRIEQVRAQQAQSQTQGQRQSSGTPLPQTPSGGYGVYDGAEDRTFATPGVATVETQGRERSASAIVG